MAYVDPLILNFLHKLQRFIYSNFFFLRIRVISDIRELKNVIKIIQLNKYYKI